MATTYTRVKRYKRGATHSDGTPFLCVRCRIEKNQGERLGRTDARRRANQGTVKALSGGTLPVAYCDQHMPEELQEGTS